MAPHQITITIRKPEDLFIDSPEENPMQPDWAADSGLQRVANFLKVRRLARGVRVIIQYPNTVDVPPQGMELLKQAIDRYCDARIAENSREREFTIRTGLTGLAYGMAVSLLLSAVMNALLSVLVLPEWIEAALLGLVTVGVWAIVWGPLAAIFFDWLPNWTAIRVFRTIKHGQFELKPIVIEEPDSLFGQSRGK
jgi:hypothetical protein